MSGDSHLEENISAIASNLRMLERLLSLARRRTAEAHGLVEVGQYVEGMSLMVGVDRTLEDAKKLYEAARVRHQHIAR